MRTLLFASLLLLTLGLIFPSNLLFCTENSACINVVQCYGHSLSSRSQKLSILGQSENSISINIKALDAITRQPIQNATIILWDLSTFEEPILGAGIYFTDNNGECDIVGDYLKLKHIYWLYAYKGSFKTKTIDYLPVKREIIFDNIEKINITLLLVPGALIELEGVPYIVQSSDVKERYMVVRVKVLEKLINYSFIREYGNTPDSFLLGLSKKMIAVPAGVPFVLETKLWFLSTEQARIAVKSEIFTINNESLPFMMSQGDFLSIKIPSYSLGRGVEYINSILEKVYREIRDARSIGFTVFDEERAMANIYREKMEAESLLQNARTDEEFKRVWLMLREVLGGLNYISMVIQNKYFIGKTNAVYLSAVTAVFSIVLAFFFFENNKKKIISSVLFYAVLLGVLYLVHPGAHVIIDENLPLFLESVFISFAVFSAIIFGIPRIWKERSVEGEVSWRSAISIIFSMGKRQIKRKKIRGFFTIFSICILVLTFTSLTSFGTVIGIVSETVNVVPPSEGILVKKMINGSSLLFSPLGYGDIAAISEIIPMANVALREKNIPRVDPIARLVNRDAKTDRFIYGIIAISPTNESLYTDLDEIIVEGEYLSDEAYGEVLISSNVAKKLGVGIGDNVTIEITDITVSDTFTVKGLINDDEYENLIDIDGSYFGPSRLLEDGSVRRCNSTEIIVINLKTADKLQRMIDVIAREHKTVPPQLVQLSEIVFQPKITSNIEANIKRIISTHGYDVFVSSNKIVTYYHFGSYIEFKGVAELLIPMIMVILNVSMVMVNSAYERSKEIRVLSMLGLNPTHIGLTFVAEATVMGMVGGSVGYLAGLGFYRIMIFFGQDLMVREKLEWWWSALGFALAILISVLSAMRPATMAVRAYTPSRIKRVRMLKEEMKKRREEIFKVYEAREVSMPVKVLTNEIEFFVGYFLDRLNDLRSGYMERTEEIEETPEMESVRGELIKTIKFNYYFGEPEKRIGTKNTLILVKSPDEEYYRIKLKSDPVTPGIPESAVDRTISFVHDILVTWIRDKKRIMGMA